MEGAEGPETVQGARGVEEGIQQAVDLCLEGVRGPVACVEAVAEGNYCSPVADMLAASWVVGRWKEEEGLEAVLQEVDKHGGDMVGFGVRSWVAWGRKRDLQSSSLTAGSGSLLRTCRSWWWT